MPDKSFHDHDVLVAGAGPTGLLLACELRLAGCSVLVLEQAVRPHARSKEMPFGLRGLTVPTIEAFDRRGLLDALRKGVASRDTQGATRFEQRQPRHGGHFAGIDFFYDEQKEEWPHRLPGDLETMAADLATIEAVLTDRAHFLGVKIRRGSGVDEVRQSDGYVEAVCGRDVFRGLFLVGCDGGRSTVRKSAGFAFVGTEPEFTGYSAQVVLADPALLEPGRNLAPGGVYIYAPPDTLWLADFDGGAAHRTVALDRAHIEKVLARVADREVAVNDVIQATSWTDRAFLATRYRRGRILLAGDAAHVHSPLGGQGLNLGLGDAMNLGWKLASVVRGVAPEGLLDSYEQERRPVATQILDRSRAQVALLRPDPGSRALEALMGELIGTADGNRYFAERISGIGLHYDLDGQHPLVGRSVPNFVCADGKKLNAHLRDGRGLLLELASHPDLRTTMDAWQGRVAHLVAEAPEWRGIRAVLVRPDGIVAWVSAGESKPAALERALDRWFGAWRTVPRDERIELAAS